MAGMATVAAGSSPAPSTSGSAPSCAGPAGPSPRHRRRQRGLVALGGRALGIDCLLQLIVKARDTLGLRGLGLDSFLSSCLDAGFGIGRSLAFGPVLGVCGGNGLVRILALGLGAHTQHQVAQARDRALHVRAGWSACR